MDGRRIRVCVGDGEEGVGDKDGVTEGEARGLSTWTYGQMCCFGMIVTWPI